MFENIKDENGLFIGANIKNFTCKSTAVVCWKIPIITMSVKSAHWAHSSQQLKHKPVSG